MNTVKSGVMGAKLLTGHGTAKRLHVCMCQVFPLLTERLFVEVTCNDDGSRNGVEDAENANAYHQLLQFFCLGAVVLHNGTDAEQRDKSSQKERRSDEEVNEEGARTNPRRASTL